MTIQAAPLITRYEELKLTEEEAATAISSFDLRARDLSAPWCERNKLAGVAIGILETIRSSVSVLTDIEGEKRFSAVAKQIRNNQTEATEGQKVAAAAELRSPATTLVPQMDL